MDAIIQSMVLDVLKIVEKIVCIVTTAITVPNVHRDIGEHIAQEIVIKTVLIVLHIRTVKSASPDFLEAGVVVVVFHNV